MVALIPSILIQPTSKIIRLIIIRFSSKCYTTSFYNLQGETLIMTLRNITIASAAFFTLVNTQVISTESTTQARTALIMGNSEYKEIGVLKNPVHDAKDMRDTLKSLGFTVIYLENAPTRSEMRKAVDEFYDILNQRKGIGLFFYAGHGIQVKGENYLIPIDAKVRSESDIEDELLAVNKVLGKMEDAQNALNIIVLDACRDNPFKNSRSLSRSISSTRGLATPTQDLGGSMIAFATAAHQVAADGSGRNGLYTKHFKEWIKKPGLKIEDVLKGVRVAVRKETGNKQTPFEYGSINTDFCFVSCAAGNYDELIRQHEEKEKKIIELSKVIEDMKTKSPMIGNTPTINKEALKLQGEIEALQKEINMTEQKLSIPSRSITDTPLSSRQEEALELMHQIEQELAK